MQRHIGFYLNLLALGLFIPGILLPMFSLNMELSALMSNTSISSDIINKELSLISTIEELWKDERLFVAFLIFIFSIAIPLIKTLLLTVAYFKKHTFIEQRLIALVSAIGKWSMADVFVVAIFIAVLSTNHGETFTKEVLNIFGFKIELLISSETVSMVGAGFYYFTAYCLVSLLGCQFSQYAANKIKNTTEETNSKSD